MKAIKGIARVEFFPGKLEEWKRLTEQAMEIVRSSVTPSCGNSVLNNDTGTAPLRAPAQRPWRQADRPADAHG
jgi:hypothetical protein